MGFWDEYEKLKKKRLGLTDDETESKTENTTANKTTNKSSGGTFWDEYNRLKEERLAQEEEEEDIAPFLPSVRVPTKTEEKPWYQSGVFADGYQFGDVSKHILGLVSGTADDVAPYVVGVNNDKKNESAITDNGTENQEDSLYIMNYKPGVDGATRQSIYDANAKRIAEIDAQLARTESGKTSFWQSTNPIGWVADKLSDSTKALEEERKKLVEANAQYDKYGNAVDLSYDELIAKRDAADDNADRLYYLSLANQRKLSDNAELMANTKMDGTDHSVYEELQQIATMENGEEKEKRKAAAIKKMESLGVNVDDYALYSDDENFSWGTFFDWLGNTAMSGLASFNKGLTSTVDLLLGQPLQAMGWENNPISSMAQYYSDSYDNYKFDANLLAEKLGGGKGYEYAGAAIEGTTGALPNAILALMTSGASLGGTGVSTTSSLATKAAYESGNILTKAGLTTSAMAKNPQYWLSFAQTYGTDYEEAKSKGADDFTAAFGATLSSLINAGIEIGIDGGSGFQGLPDKVAKGDKNAIFEWLKSGIEEGGEEGAQKLVNEVITKYLYDHDAEILNPVEYATEMGIGTLSGLALGGGQIAVQSGTNAITNAIQEHEAKKLTETEQKVFDKVFEDRIAEESENGEVTNKRKKEIREEILNEMEKGYLSTDTIEEVLAGDSYKAYKDNIANEEAIRKEYDELYNMKNGDKSSAQVDREAELKKMLEEIDNGTTRSDLRSKLNDEVFGIIKGSRLANSYIESDNRTKAFTADLTKYDEKMRPTVQKAIDSGILNNTNRTREFVDMVAKISADKGVSFDFINNKKLKESIFAVDGKQVNAYVTKDGITLNINSAKALNTVVGHEITHVLEGTEFYNELQSALFEYAKSKNDYQGRYDSISQLYKDIKDADFNAELTADLVGDYLFTDSDFIHNLSTNHRNLFQKIYDEIKYLCKVATDGSKEARQLEKVKHAFENAYRAGGKANAKTGTQYSLKISHTDGSVEELSDARSLTNEQAVDYLKKAKSGELRGETYIPVRKDTPQVIIDTLEQVGDNVNNLSLVMQVRKAQQSMRTAKTGRRTEKYGNNVRNHALTPEQIVEIVNNLDNPSSIIYQTNRYDKNGNPLPNNVAVFVEYNNNGNESVAVIEFESSINPESIGTDFGDTNYHTVVTVFEPDVERYGMEFDYAEELLSNPDNIELKIERRRSAESVTRENHPNTFDKSPSSVDIVPQTESEVKHKFSISDSDGNQAPTTDPDIRFSISKPVEETKDLLVLHNITESKFLKQLELDGFPMPSLAVTNQPHTNFGSISILFDKDTIDPKKNKKNKTYSADAWTPTFPRIEYEADRNITHNFVENLRGLIDDDYYHGSVGSVLYDVEDILNRNGGYDGLIDNLADKPAIQYAFLKSKGENIEIAQKAKEVDLGFSTDERWINRYEGLIADFEGDISNLGQVPYTELVEQSPTLKNLLDKYPMKSKMQQLNLISRVINGAKAYQNYDPNAKVEAEYIPDYAQTDKDMQARIDTNELKTWLKEQTKGIVANSGVYNGKEIFTPSGNRRSFQQLHYPVTVENIVKSMASQGEKSVTSFHGVKTLRATTAKTFKSIAEIQKAKGKLQNLSESEVEQIHEELSGKMYEVFHKIIEENPNVFREDDIFALDTIGEVLSEVEYENINASYIKGVFNKYGYTLSSETADDCFKLLDAISSMPVYIFEAKPRRVVGYDEIKAVVIPEDTSVELKNALTERGIGFVEYDGTEADRQAKLKDVATANDSYFSLSEEGEHPIRQSGNVYGEDIMLETAPTQDVAPVQETVSNTETVAPEATTQTDVSPVQVAQPDEYNSLLREKADLERRLMQAATEGSENEAQLAEEYNALTDRINRIEADESTMQRDRFNSLTDEDAPPEIEAPYYGESETVTPDDPFANRDIKEVGNRKIKAYMYENPEVKPFFQDEARGMLGDLRSTTKGERWYNDKLYYESNGEYGFSGTKRHTTDDIAYLLDEFGYTYAEIEKGLNAIIEDNGAENNAVSKRIEFMLDERLRKGYTGVFGEPIPANQEYINLLNEKQIMEYSDEARQNFMEHADEYAPLYTEENIGQDVAQSIAPDVNENAHPVQEAPIKEEAVEDSTDPIPPEQKEKIARIRKANPKAAEGSWWTRTKKKLNNAITLLGDKGWAIENLSKKSGNSDLEAKYDFMKNRSGGVAQEYINDNLLPILDRIEESGKRNPSVSVVEVDGSTISDYMEQLDYYTKHLHNIDRMSLDTEEDKARRQEIRSQLEGYTENQIQSIASEKITRNTPSDRVETIYLAREYIDLGGEKGKNKPVFGYSVTADVSRKQVEKYESVHPEFIELAQEVNAYFKELRQFAVNQGLIKQTVADKWQGMYPHYVATSRTDRQGASVSVPLDSNKTGVNNPFKRATGGNGDFEPLAETMAKNTIQIFRAVHRNGFGLELQNTLENLYGSETTKTVDDSDIDVSDILEATQENDGSVLQAGKNGKPPQFTVFVKGKRVTFDITEDIYNALKPVEGELAKTHAIPNKIAEGYKKVLTELDPFFALVRNPIKDTKDVLFNSRHAFATYSTAPKTMKEIASKGKYFTEYIKNGGKTTSYYDTKKQTFDRVDGGKWYGFPWRKYKQASENVEMFWRLSEYIASREAGESIEVAMLDSARVTTNFGAGADLTKWANRNGAMFLNPSVQGVMQNVRNVREAYHQGVKGSAILAAKVIATGLGGMFFNWLLWHDDEEYEELSEYVKQNYFCIWKTPDGKFIRIPKGRMEAVIQNGFEQMGNLITGNDDVDIETFLSLVKNNIAPNNPFENNLISPISQATSNTAWYGEELVPARLQNLPAAEQFDESTDEISKWLGKTFNISPYKVNYVLSQYGGGFADLVLPMLTNEAEGSSFFAPIADEFISDPLLKNQNVSDFYDKKDELTVNANSSKATDEDVLMSKYMNSINSELSELYKQKREIQNSSLSDAEKYEQVRDIQSQIVELTRESLNTYDDIEYHSARDGEYSSIGDRYFKLDDDGEWQKLSDDQVTKYKVTSAAGDAPYASDGENHYHWYEPGEDSDAEPGWRKITEEQLEKQKEVTSGLDITPEEYWSNKDEYDYAYKYPGNYAVSKAVGSYESYRQYSSELYDIKADKDANGKSISGSRKEKVIDYLNDLDIDYGSRMILFKSEYPADDTYNYDIINYLEENDAISADDMRTILTELGFKVHDNGTITWD